MCEKIRSELETLVNKYGKDRSSLKPILHELQEKYHSISEEQMQVLADLLGIHAIQVQEVVTFYSFYNSGKKGKYIIRMCQTMPCKMAGAKDVMRQLESKLGIKFGETTADGKFSLEWTNCIGMCDQGPAFLINEQPYTRVKPEEVDRIIEEYKEKAVTMIESNYVSELTFASIDAKESFEKAKKQGSNDIIDEVTKSKLKGCGGAGFPTGLKLSLMSKEEGNPKYVICNADEGEPGTFKDREILTHYSDVVFTGMAIAGLAIGAEKGILYLRAEYAFMREHIENSIQKCHEFTGFDIELRFGAGAYVCGEETALIESLEGKRGEPRNRPPFPIQDGYLGKPTEVNNVETFAWITSIIDKGANWFSSFGTEKSAGLKVFSISGDCKQPGIYEFPMGTTIERMLKDVGGEGAKAVQMGGASGETIPAADFGRKIAFEDASPGGSIIVFGKDRNMLDVAENFMEFFVEESCGQCTPCRKGNVKLLEAVKKMKTGECNCSYFKDIQSLCNTMQLASKCGLGQTSSRSFLAIMEHFKDEIKCGGKK